MKINVATRHSLPSGLKYLTAISKTNLAIPCTHNRLCIESFLHKAYRRCVNSRELYRLRLNPRGFEARHRNCKALFHRQRTKRRREEERQRGTQILPERGRIILPWPITTPCRPLHLCQRQGSNQNIAQTVSHCMPCWNGVYSSTACTMRLCWAS